MAVCGFVIYAAWDYRNGVLDENVMAGQVFTPARGAMIIVVGMCGIQLHFLSQLVIDLTYLTTKRAVPSWWVAEAAHGGEVGISDDKTVSDKAVK